MTSNLNVKINYFFIICGIVLGVARNWFALCRRECRKPNRRNSFTVDG